MTSKKSNEIKLIRNLDNIIKNYIKSDDEQLIQTLLTEDKDKFKTIVADKSTDNFLRDIVEEYDVFTDLLMEQLTQVNDSKITQLKEEQTKIKRTYKKSVTPTKKTKVKPTQGKVRTIKKRQIQSWDSKEEQRITTLIKSNKKSGQIIKEINDKRTSQDKPVRSNSSYYSKIHRLKKKINEGKK